MTLPPGGLVEKERFDVSSAPSSTFFEDAVVLLRYVRDL